MVEAVKVLRIVERRLDSRERSGCEMVCLLLFFLAGIVTSPSVPTPDSWLVMNETYSRDIGKRDEDTFLRRRSPVKFRLFSFVSKYVHSVMRSVKVDGLRVPVVADDDGKNP